MYTDLTDEQIVRLSVSKDPEAFGEIVKRWDRKIFALCFGMLGREDEARDAAQETFVSAYRGLSGFRGDAKVSSWLHRIAVNKCLSEKRRQKARPEDVFDDSDGSGSPVFIAPDGYSPAGTAEKDERFVLVRQAVNSLPVDLRQVVVMKEFEEMTFLEISETLELPLSTVKSRLYTALRQLRLKLERTPIEIL